MDRRNKILQGNCLDLMKDFPDELVDLTVTSPPYGNLRSYQGYSFDFEGIAKELYRITKKGGVLVWVVGDQTNNGSESGTSFRQALFFKEIGFNLHDTMIYNKGSCPFPETTRYYPCFEYMFVFVKGKIKTVNLLIDRLNKEAGSSVDSSTYRQKDNSLKESSSKKNNKNRKIKEYGVRYNIWEYSPGYGKSTLDKIAFEHPATFPEKLAEDHIKSWSNPGDLVFDPFMGSGTTAKMAKINDRDYLGCEISDKYIDIAQERVKNINPLHKWF